MEKRELRRRGQDMRKQSTPSVKNSPFAGLASLIGGK
jgi:hypothetical protein